MGGAVGIIVTNAGVVDLRNLRIRGAQVGVEMGGSKQCALKWVFVEGCATGFRLLGSDNTLLQHCLAKGAISEGVFAGSAGLVWENGVLWSNTAAVSLGSGSLTVRNSILGALGAGSYIYSDKALGGQLDTDYNCIFLTNGAMMGYKQGTPTRIYHTVSRWVRDTENDEHSLTGDPLFYNAQEGDYHLLSKEGRFNLATTSFVSDARSSLLIDAGDPFSVYTNEISPNGKRCNIGLYANSPEASKTATNSVLVVLSLNDGGRVEGAKVLHWGSHGNATGHTVSVKFSADGGSSWVVLGSNINASEDSFVWDTRLNASTALGVWSVTDEVETNVFDRSDVYFAVRNLPLSFYVNDTSTNGDAYTTSAGDPNNLGVYPTAPKDSVAGILSAWDLEPGDTVYVDTGQYWIENTLTIDRFDAWESTNDAGSIQELTANRVTIQGSTNEHAGGTIFTKYGDGNIIYLDSALGVAVRNLTLQTRWAKNWRSS